jgi:hypothetical protein
MVQILRPNDLQILENFTGSHTDIDEVTPSDADFVWSTNNTTGIFRSGLTDPVGTPQPGTGTVRFRYAKTNAGTPDSGGSNCQLIVAVNTVGNVFLAASGTLSVTSGTWTEGSFTFNIADVNDWNGLRVQFDVAGGGGSPANRRGVGVSWIEVEITDPDPIFPSSGTAAGTSTATGEGAFGNPPVAPVVSGTTGSPTITPDVTFDGVVGTTYKWTGAGSITFSEPGDVYYLVIAGGASGGETDSAFEDVGGGGAGGMVGGYLTSRFPATVSAYAITVGLGGVPNTVTPGRGLNGGNSSIAGTNAPEEAIGGGGGARQNTGAANAGGSGGGQMNSIVGPALGTAGQGNNGGIIAELDSQFGSAGGGGAGAPGGSCGGAEAGDGGAGRASSITGTEVFYAGGGGGGKRTTSVGGIGGGGAGGSTGSTYALRSGTDGLGGGGAGGRTGTDGTIRAGKGGDGVVILFVPDPVSGVTSSSGTAAGAATASGEGIAIKTAGSTAAGVATVTGEGVAIRQSSGTAAGVATVTGVGEDASSGETIVSSSGTAAGAATVSGEGRHIVQSSGTAAGVATVTGVGDDAYEPPSFPFDIVLRNPGGSFNVVLSDVAPPVGGRVKYWTGSAWKPVKSWTGTEWVFVKAFDGVTMG